jgi:hypothetical protein
MKSPEVSWLEDYLISAILFRIGQGDAYLRVAQLPAEFFTEELGASCVWKILYEGIKWFMQQSYNTYHMYTHNIDTGSNI